MVLGFYIRILQLVVHQYLGVVLVALGIIERLRGQIRRRRSLGTPGRGQQPRDFFKLLAFLIKRPLVALENLTVGWTATDAANEEDQGGEACYFFHRVSFRSDWLDLPCISPPAPHPEPQQVLRRPEAL